MKIFMISDTHFGVYPISYDKWMKMMVDYFDNWFIPMLKEKAEEGDILIHLGDLFDNRSQIPIDVLNEAERIMVEISEILPVRLLVGNHDIFNKASNNVNSPKPLRWVPNITIYEHTEKIDVGDKSVVMMPWVEKKKDQVELLKQHSGSDYIFCHSDLNGCRMHLNSVAHTNHDKIDVEEFSGYKKVFSGHIHIRQQQKNFTFIGSPYQLDRNDYGDQKGIYILDTQDDSTEFIPNEYSPVFQKVKVMEEDDLEKLDDVDTSKNYVDLSVSNSLLINNRKLRRKLEKMLEQGHFSKVEYINDVVKKVDEGVDSDELKEIDVDKIDFNDFENIIVEYINSQDWKNEKMKQGVLDSFNNIISIYKSKYKIQKMEE